jgi:hypothetical protein
LTSLDANVVKDLVVQLLIDKSFQIGLVDDALFNIVGMASEQQKLSSTDKGSIYHTSRAPLKTLIAVARWESSAMME